MAISISGHARPDPVLWVSCQGSYHTTLSMAYVTGLRKLIGPEVSRFTQGMCRLPPRQLIRQGHRIPSSGPILCLRRIHPNPKAFIGPELQSNKPSNVSRPGLPRVCGVLQNLS